MAVQVYLPASSLVTDLMTIELRPGMDDASFNGICWPSLDHRKWTGLVPVLMEQIRTISDPTLVSGIVRAAIFGGFDAKQT